MEIDLENEFWSNFNQRQPRLDGTVRKRLFPTPVPTKSSKVQRTSTSPSLLTTSSITNQFFLNQNPPVTPRIVHESGVSNRKRPSVANIEGTPSVRKRIVCSNPDACHARQAADLSAWLNYELLHSLQPTSSPNGLGNFPQHNLSQDNDFLNQLSGMRHLFHSGELHGMRLRLVNDLRELPIDPIVDFTSDGTSRRMIVSHILLNYHPAWLLPALCVLFDTNLAIDLDAALYTARNTNPSAQDHFTLMQFLEDVLCIGFLSPNRYVFSNMSQEMLSNATSPVPPLVARKNFHRLIMERILELIFLLDFSGTTPDIFVHADPPLFRHDSSVTSSGEFLSVIEKSFFEPDRLQSILRHRQYTLRYRMPKCEVRRDLHISDLAQDLRDGIRLCKLAALFTKDRKILEHVRVPSPQKLQKEIHDIRLHNIQLAMRALLRFAQKTTKEAVEWYASPMEVATGNLPTILPFLWQLVAMWRDSVLFITSDLSSELEVVKEEFRKNRPKVARLSQSPTAEMTLNELSPSIRSPSNLCIYEKCKSPNSTLLLEWSAVVCGMYGLVIRDFSASFRDGAALSLMLHFYHPEIIRSEEIVHVAAAEVRAPEAAEAEMILAQNNFDLFVNRLRVLGAFPNVHISAESVLGASSLTIETQQSFGRLMDITLSYLFRHIMSKRVSGGQERIESLMEENRTRLTEDLAARLISKSLKQLHVLKRLERIGSSPKVYTRSPGCLEMNSSPVHGRSGSRPSVFSPSKPPRISPSAGMHVEVFGEPSKNANMFSSSKPPKHGVSKISSFLSPSKKIDGFTMKVGATFSPSKSLSPKLGRSVSELDPIQTIRRLRDDTSRRIYAATVIANTYRAWRARREVEERKKSIIYLQACGRSYLARRVVRDKFSGKHNTSRNNHTLTPGTLNIDIPDPLLLSKALSPVNSGVQLTAEVLPRVQDHMRALERFISRMEKEEAERSQCPQTSSPTVIISQPLQAHPSNAAQKLPSPPRPESHSSPVQDYHSENTHRKTWRELAISAAAGGVKYLAQTVFENLVQIADHVDSTLHEGNKALYLSARKPPVHAVGRNNAPSENAVRTKVRPVIETGHGRTVLGTPLDSRNQNIYTQISDNNSSPGIDEFCISPGVSSHNILQRCKEAESMVVEISARKEELNSMLGKLRREEMANEIPHRQSISRIEEQLSGLDKTSEELSSKLEYVQGLSSKRERGATKAESFGSENQSPHCSHVRGSILGEHEISLRVIAEEKLKARLADAEDAFAVLMTEAEERRCCHKRLGAKLDHFETMTEKIQAQFANEFEALDRIVNSLDHEYANSTASEETIIETLDVTSDELMSIPDFATELTSMVLHTPIPDTDDIQHSYTLIIADRLRERLSEAEDRFLDEYRERLRSSLKHWLAWMGYVILLRELNELSESDCRRFKEDMDTIDHSCLELEKYYEMLVVMDSGTNFEEIIRNETLYDEEIVPLDALDAQIQTGYIRALQTHELTFRCVMAQRIEERHELAEEKFLEDMLLRKAAHTADWCERKTKELEFRSAEETLQVEENAANNELESSMCSWTISSDTCVPQFCDISTDAFCSLDSDATIVSEHIQEANEISDELEVDYTSSIVECDSLMEKIRKGRLAELLVSAQDSYDNFMAAQRLSHVENWLRKVKCNLEDREHFVNIEEISAQGTEDEVLSHLLREVEKQYEDAAKWISSLLSKIQVRLESDDSDYTYSISNIVGTEPDHLQQEIFEGNELEFNNVLSCRLTESLERASDRFDEELLQRRLCIINAWLRKKFAEINMRELDAEIAENVKTGDAEMQALQESCYAVRSMYDIDREEVLSEKDLQTLHSDSSDLSLESSHIVIDEIDPTDEIYYLAVKESEQIQCELLEMRLYERHNRAEQEFEDVMMSCRLESLTQWLKRTDRHLSIRELDEEYSRVSREYIASSQEIEGSCSSSVPMEYSELAFIEGILSMQEAPEIVARDEKHENDSKDIYDVLEETGQILKELYSEREVEAYWEIKDPDCPETAFDSSPSCAEITQNDSGPIRAARVNKSDFVESDVPQFSSSKLKAALEISPKKISLNIKPYLEAVEEPLLESASQKLQLKSATKEKLSSSLSVFIPPAEKATEGRGKKDDDDFVSLSSFATSKNSSRHSEGNDFVSLSSLGTSHFPSAMGNRAFPNIFSGRLFETPYTHERYVSFGEQINNSINQWNDTVSPNIALWRIGDTPLRNREEVLKRLSAELDAIGKDMSPNGTDLVMNDRDSADRLQGVMRRISMATGSPFFEETPRTELEDEKISPSFVGLVRMVLVVMRTCIRSEEYVALVQLGMKIIKDLCTVQQRIRDIIEVEESVDVISTCVQFYRDDENIFKEGVEVLHAMSGDPHGVALLKESKDVVSRLARVKEVMAEQLKRSQRNEKRLRQANIVKSLLAQRKGGQRVVGSLAEQIRKMQDNDGFVEEKLGDAIQKLELVVESSQ